MCVAMSIQLFDEGAPPCPCKAHKNKGFFISYLKPKGRVGLILKSLQPFRTCLCNIEGSSAALTNFSWFNTTLSHVKFSQISKIKGAYANNPKALFVCIRLNMNKYTGLHV